MIGLTSRNLGALVIPIVVCVLVFIGLAIDEHTHHDVVLSRVLGAFNNSDDDSSHDDRDERSRNTRSSDGDSDGGSARVGGDDDAGGGGGGHERPRDGHLHHQRQEKTSSPVARHKATTKLRVMSYNVQNWDDGQWPSRAGMVAAEIRAANPDIIALQELRRWNDGRGPSQADDLAALLPEYTIAWAEGMRYREDAEGLAIMTRKGRCALLEVDHQRLASFHADVYDKVGPGSLGSDRNERICQRAVIAVRLNTHRTVRAGAGTNGGGSGARGVGGGGGGGERDADSREGGGGASQRRRPLGEDATRDNGRRGFDNGDSEVAEGVQRGYTTDKPSGEAEEEKGTPPRSVGVEESGDVVEVLVINSHLSYDRKTQTHNVASMLEKCVRGPRPVKGAGPPDLAVLMGDFNTHEDAVTVRHVLTGGKYARDPRDVLSPGSTPRGGGGGGGVRSASPPVSAKAAKAAKAAAVAAARAAGVTPLKGAEAFVDAWAEVHGAGLSDFSATFRSDRGGPNARCDYVMVRGGDRIRPVEVFLAGGLREGVKVAAVNSSVPGKPPPAVPSDHKAVVADLDLDVGGDDGVLSCRSGAPKTCREPSGRG